MHRCKTVQRCCCAYQLQRCIYSDPFAIWKWTSAGKLSNMGSQLCLGAAMQRGSLGMISCDGSGSEWEFTVDGQLRSKGTSSCVTAKGQAGVRNVAFKAAAVASSTANDAHNTAWQWTASA